MRRVLLGLAMSVAGLYFAFRGTDFRMLGGALLEVRLKWVAVGMALIVASVWLRALRWVWLMEPIGRVRLSVAYQATMIGYFGNNVLPVRMGEVMRAFALPKIGGMISAPAAFGSIVVERLADMGSAALLMALFFGLSEVPAPLARAGWIVGGVVAAGVGALFVLHRANGKSRVSAPGRSTGRFSFGAFASQLATGLTVIGGIRKKSGTLLVTLLLWLIYFTVTCVSAASLGIRLSWIQIGTTLLATTLAMTIPSAPGFVGTYHLAAVFVLRDMYGLPASGAQSFAVVNHAMGFIPLTVLGLYEFVRHSFKLSEMKTVVAEERL